MECTRAGRRRVASPLAAGLVLATSLCFVSGQGCETARGYFDQANALPNTMQGLIHKEQLYRRAIEVCPSHAASHNNLGDCFEQEGRFEEAIVEYRRAAELMPKSATPCFGLGDVYFKTGRPSEALEWYQKGLKIDPEDRLSNQRARLCRDLIGSKLILATTIQDVFRVTRGAGEVVTLPFGEGLIPFDYNRADIRPDARPQLDEIGKALERLSQTVQIAGHTDSRGSDSFNQRLSLRRAQAVVDYLVKTFRIPRERLSPVGYGEGVPLCTAESSEPCHALNRRVELAIQPEPSRGPQTRGVAEAVGFRSQAGPPLAMDLGFFAQRQGERKVEILSEESRLRSRSDGYFIFLRPLQDCFVYVIQEDALGKVDVLVPPTGGSAAVRARTDHWIPGPGKAYTLDDSKGTEKLHVVVTSERIDFPAEGPLAEQVRNAARSLRTRMIRPVPPSSRPDNVSQADLQTDQERLSGFLEKVEGNGGWVRSLSFQHE